jgi:hypothetical protein
MTWPVALLAVACLAAFGLLVWLWVSRRIEQRAERSGSTAPSRRPA